MLRWEQLLESSVESAIFFRYLILFKFFDAFVIEIPFIRGHFKDSTIALSATIML
jgi:hypothetical protein